MIQIPNNIINFFSNIDKKKKYYKQEIELLKELNNNTNRKYSKIESNLLNQFLNLTILLANNFVNQ